MRKIKMVLGAEPRRNGEYPAGFQVGFPMTSRDRVDAIFEEDENFGSYGIKWYVAKRADGSTIEKMNALHTASVTYFRDGEEPPKARE